MSVRHLDAILKPRRIAVVGATDRQGSVGRAVLRNLLERGFDGEVYAVNPGHDQVGGIRAYRAVGELPELPDLAVVCTPREAVPDVVEQCGDSGVRGVVILTAGFREIGAEGAALQQRLDAVRSRYRRLRIIGPNSFGVIVPELRMSASFAADMPAPGHLAFVSQSGSLCAAVLDWAMEQGVGFSQFVSVGNMADVDFGDLIDYLAADAQTRALLLYIESITQARKFLSAARAFTRTKPIVAYKAGRFAESAAAAASHTGSMAGSDAVCDAALRRAGIERVFSIDDLFDCAELLSCRRPLPQGRMAIVTNAGGPGVVATERLIDRGGAPAQLSGETLRRLNAVLPPCWSHGNPVDVIGDAPPERIVAALRIVLEDPGVDAVLIAMAPHAMIDPAEIARAVVEVAQESSKSILAACMGGLRIQEARKAFSGAGIPVYHNAEGAVDAFMHLVSFARNHELLHETPRQVPITYTPHREEARRGLLQPVLESGRQILLETESKSLLEAYGLRAVHTIAASSPRQAVEAAETVGLPVAMKVLSPQISHKSDVGGVLLNISTLEQVRTAFARITAGAQRNRPDAEVIGVTIQPMIDWPGALELILGSRQDETFGAAIMLGAGGTLAEVLRDRVIELPPLNERLARRMLDSLRIRRLFDGYRGRPPIDVEALLEVLMRFSYLVAENPSIQEMDVNPLLVGAEGALVLDARVVVDRHALEHPPPAFSHLAIRPYPDELVREQQLRDGTVVRLRPLRPEDEPAWVSLLGRCSPDAVWFHMGSRAELGAHPIAARYCFVDYDREMPMVAEVVGQGAKLVGVGRLVTDADRENAELAVLVEGAWQKRGLGSLITDECLAIARRCGMRRVTAFTPPANAALLSILAKRGFLPRRDERTGWIVAELPLNGEGRGRCRSRV